MRISDLEGKAYLVTGGSTGIGAGLVKALHAQGAKVALHYNSSRAAAEEVVDSLDGRRSDVVLLSADLTQRGLANDLVAKADAAFGRLDGLVNNAGSLVGVRTIEQYDDAFFDEMVNLNCRSLVFASQAAVASMRRAGGGVIINTTSIAARHGGGGGAILYASAKAFVSTFTRGLAKALAKENIRVNAVSPGVILTPFHERFTSEAGMNAMVATIPMGRAGTVEECVGTYLYLLSGELSSYVTGQIVEVNGAQLVP